MTGTGSDNLAPGSDVPLVVRGLVKHFPITSGLLQRRTGAVRAVDGVSFAIPRGETLGLVGESGCGKSTVARAVMRLVEPDAGEIRLAGVDITKLSASEMWAHRRHIQTVFQDPYSSLNPRMTAGAIVGEPLENFGLASGAEQKKRVGDLLAKVGLRPEAAERYVQAQVLNLLIGLQDELGLTYLFISHDLAVVRHISHRVAVMYLGRIVELAPKRQLFTSPMHPYTEALLAAAPAPNPARKGMKRTVLGGDVPSPANPPPGCRFHTRCPYAEAECRVTDPPLVEVGPGRYAACIKRPAMR